MATETVTLLVILIGFPGMFVLGYWYGWRTHALRDFIRQTTDEIGKG